MKKAACYCRVSTRKDEQLESLEKQKEFFDSYFANNKQYELYEIYVDEGLSGKSLKNRKDFNRMICHAQKGYFDVILVKDISRFARNTLDLLSSIRMLREYNVKVLFITNNMDTFDNSEFIVTLFGALAQEESENMSKRIKFSKNMTARQGRVPNLVFGYDRTGRFTLEPNAYEADWVKKIFAMYVYGGAGTAKIAEHLNKLNVATKKGLTKGWTQHVISYMLQNELYIGKVVNKKSEVADFKTGKRREYGREDWIVTDRPEFKIIDEELFNMARKLLAARKDSFHLDKKRPSGKYPLSNLIQCANDGYSFRRCSRQYCDKGKVYTWWACSYRNAKGASACSNDIRLDEEQMHAAVLEFFRCISGSREELSKQVEDCVEKELRRRYKHNDNRRELLSELKSLETKKNRLLDAYSDGLIDKDDLGGRVHSIAGRIAEINAALNGYGNYEEAGAAVEKAVADFMKRMEARPENLLSNAFLKTVFEKFLVHEDGKITAVVRMDYDAELSVSIPFGEMLEQD